MLTLFNLLFWCGQLFSNFHFRGFLQRQSRLSKAVIRVSSLLWVKCEHNMNDLLTPTSHKLARCQAAKFWFIRQFTAQKKRTGKQPLRPEKWTTSGRNWHIRPYRTYLWGKLKHIGLGLCPKISCELMACCKCPAGPTAVFLNCPVGCPGSAKNVHGSSRVFLILIFLIIFILYGSNNRLSLNKITAFCSIFLKLVSCFQKVFSAKIIFWKIQHK